MERQKEMAEKLRKEEEKEMKLEELVRLENARLTAEHDNQIRLLKRKYAKDLMEQMEHSKTLKVGAPLNIPSLHFLKDCDNH